MKHRKSIELASGGAGSEATLGELAQWYELVAACPSCQHVSQLDRYELAQRYGKGMRVADIGPKLRCKRCGNRKDNRVGLRIKSRD
jgi:hypothetical protein